VAHTDPSARLALFIEASDIAIGASLQQRVCDAWQLLASYDHKLSPAQQKYSPYEPELLAVFVAIKYFQHMIEGRPVVFFTGHKPRTYAFQERRYRCSPRHFSHLEFIGNFLLASDISQDKTMLQTPYRGRSPS
jgi:cleavage and polyadenylation specificity factor subunit 1